MMVRYTLLFMLLLTVAAYADEQPPSSALHERMQAVERQLVHSGVPENDAKVTVQAMLRARFSIEQTVRAEKLLFGEDTSGLGSQAVRNKIHEGAAKGISPGNILSAAERVRDRFSSSHRLAASLHEENNAQVIGTYADCLAAGLTEPHALQLTESLRARIGNQTKSGGHQNLALETLYVARDMVRRNISSDTTNKVLQSALAHGYKSEEMRTLRGSLASGSGEPEALARHLGAAIDQGVHAGNLQGPGENRSGAASAKDGGQGAAGGSGGSGGSAGGDAGGSAGGSSGGNSGGNGNGSGEGGGKGGKT